jgi:signal transduction histidine kinase
VGYSELLMDGIYGQLTAQQVDRMEKIYRNGKSLLDLITDILDITKIEAGRLEMHISTFSLAEVIDEVLGQKKSDSDTKGLRVKTQLAENLSPIRADRERIQQIFHNLISNAIKFTPSGEITIEAQNAVVQNGVSKTFKLPLIGWLRDGNWLIFSVKDTGIGISAEDQSHIFDAFWQVDRSPTREFEGTGMGLAITRKLVELHEGTIWVKSLLNQGSTFFVAIPVQQELMNVVSQNGASVEHVDVTASNSTEKTSDSNL